MRKYALQPHNKLTDSKGFLSADFLFSMVIASGLCVMFFSLSLTLCMAEVGQYIAFATTRAYTSAHKDPATQKAMADKKFASFKKDKILNPLLTNGWFEITKLEVRGGGNLGDFTDRYPAGKAGEVNMPQTGVRLEFNAKLLKGKIPMLGSTDDSKEHKAFITGLMIREPSSEECYTQIRQQRYKQILELDPKRFKQILGPNSENQYVGMEDNGC